MRWICLVVTSCLAVFSSADTVSQKGQNMTTMEWTTLQVNFKTKSPMPLREQDAKERGWKLLSNGCSENNTTCFHGYRYIRPDNVERSVLIYDAVGTIAGMQLAFESRLKKEAYGKYAGAYTEVTDQDDGITRYYMTAYFSEPSNICNTNRNDHIIGENKLFFEIGEDRYMEIPLTLMNVSASFGRWIKGNCYPSMGMGHHFWYDISKDMDCNDFFPFFIMYNSAGQLHAFGNAVGVNVTGHLEYPPLQSLPMFFQRSTIPSCFSEVVISTLHNFFNVVDDNLCEAKGEDSNAEVLQPNVLVLVVVYLLMSVLGIML